MRRYGIRLINSEFESSDVSPYPSIEAATKAAIIGATKVVSESVAAGEPNAAVEVQIHCDGAILARKVVALSVSDLSGHEQRVV